MKRFLSIGLFTCLVISFASCFDMKPAESIERGNAENKQVLQESQTKMKISVTSNGKTTVFELNDSQAAKDLYDQLPLSLGVENFSSNEKIFYPPEKLKTSNTPMANAKVGSLSYYAPWGDVVMFYGNFGSASGLYDLGHCVSGVEFIKQMSGIIEIDKQ